LTLQPRQLSLIRVLDCQEQHAGWTLLYFYFLFLTFIYPGKMFENHFSFTNMTWPRGYRKK